MSPFLIGESQKVLYRSRRCCSATCDLFAELRDIVGGRAAAYEKELRRAREVAMQEIIASVSGTAVIAE